MMGRKGERGNVLFLILIAVALFAALSYAVTQSSRSGGGDASKETNLIGSAQLTQYPAGVRTSLIRMIISGEDPTTLEFNPPLTFSDCSGAPTTYNRCVFHPSGGGATYALAPSEVMADGNPGTWLFVGDNEINLIGQYDGAGDPDSVEADIIALLPGISNSICTKVNEELGITGDIDEGTGTILFASVNQMVSTNADSASTEITAAIDGSGGTIGGADATGLDGQPFGCFTQDSVNYYYHVLIER